MSNDQTLHCNPQGHIQPLAQPDTRALLAKYRIREQETPDGEGFARYNAYATVEGVESKIVNEALADDLWPEINAWIERQEDAGFAIYK